MCIVLKKHVSLFAWNHHILLIGCTQYEIKGSKKCMWCVCVCVCVYILLSFSKISGNWLSVWANMCMIFPIQYNGNRFPFSIVIKNTFFFRTWLLILSETCQVWRGPCCPEANSYLHRLSCPQFQFHPFPPSGPWICLPAGLCRCSLDPDLIWHLLLQLCGAFPFLGSLPSAHQWP